VRYSNYFRIAILSLLTSCSSGNYKEIPTFTVSLKNFENYIVLDGFAAPVKTTSVVCPSGVGGIIAYLVEDGAFVNAGDTVCRIENEQLQTSYESMLFSLDSEKARLNKTKAELDLQYALLQAQVENNDASTKIGQLDSLQLIYSPPNIRRIKELELEKLDIQKKQFDKKLTALDMTNKLEIRKMELQVQRMTTQIESIKTRLDAMIIVSPQDGIVLRANSPMTGSKFRTGDQEYSNMPVVELPELSTMKVLMKAFETEFKQINMGDSVLFTFDAMPGNMAYGKITMKAPVGTPHKWGSKVKFFDIEASVDSAIVLPAPGYTANCRVILKEIKDALVIPQVAIFDEDSIKIVYARNRRGFEMRQITTGVSSSKETVITSGLDEDDVVSLIRPSHSFIKNKVFLPTDSIKNDI